MPGRSRKARRQRRKKRIRLSLHGLRDEHPIIYVDKSWKRLNESRRRVVYFILGDKPYRYHRKRIHSGLSKILYIGMTEKNNAKQPFNSLNRKAEYLFKNVHGLKRLEVRYISALGRQRVPVADKLETACLDTFDEMFGEYPLGNDKGKGSVDTELQKTYRLFPREVVRRLLREAGD